MKKIMKWALWVLLGLVLASIVLTLVVSFLPMGKGASAYARRWERRFDACNTVQDIRHRFNCLEVTEPEEGRIQYAPAPNAVWQTGRETVELLVLTNGDWIVCASANSHYNPWGGTVVTRDSTGAIRVFFGHVCGSAGIHGHTLTEVYTNIVSTHDRKEVFLKHR